MLEPRAGAAAALFPAAPVPGRRRTQHSVNPDAQPPPSGSEEPGAIQRSPWPRPCPLPLRGSGTPRCSPPSSAPPTQGACGQTLSGLFWPSLGEAWGRHRADTGLGLWSPWAPGQHWFLEGRCGPQPLSPSHTGPHWLRAWEARRAQKDLSSAWLPPAIRRNTGPGWPCPARHAHSPAR